MGYFLGFDVAKTKMDVALINEQGTEQWTDIIPNEATAIAGLLLTTAGSHPGHELQCVVESTGCYHHPLLEAGTAVGVDVRVYNPIITRQQIKATVRGKKTDRTDALMIARLGLRGEGRLYTPEPYTTTKYYVRGQQRLSAISTSLKLYEAHLTSVLEVELTEAAQDILTAIQEQLKAARAQFIRDTVASTPSGLMRRLQTIPGIGPYIAASIIGEIQTMARFPRAKHVIAYAGLDPKIRQSGKSLNSTGRLTKRGSSYLRRSLFIAANIARQHDPNFKALYDKKRAEGKTYTVAVCVVARRLLVITRAVWLREQDYDVNLWNGNLDKPK
ncbi:MAG TPA: IS110 family transposase [Candidatus Dormibacteraeota bacterium]|nr:IS110 family transposase [Candidatus Dormibacteraeota bacterium]